jgi:hypothetical protein
VGGVGATGSPPHLLKGRRTRVHRRYRTDLPGPQKSKSRSPTGSRSPTPVRDPVADYPASAGHAAEGPW